MEHLFPTTTKRKIMTRNSKLINITDTKKFKNQNISEWKANSDFWLTGSMRHIKDVKGKAVEIIQSLLPHSDNNRTLIDVGCGEGWIYRAIKEAKIDVKYYGIDFNEPFITELSKRYKKEKEAVFLVNDIEEKEIKELAGKADIVVNAFNFFEIPDLAKAMQHTSDLIKDNGYLLILTIDPITQLLSVSDNQTMFYEYLTEYAKKQNKIGYKKRIVIGDKKTTKSYYGILYSLEDYLREVKKCNLVFQDYFEIINPAKPTPQLYQFMVFRKQK